MTLRIEPIFVGLEGKLTRRTELRKIKKTRALNRFRRWERKALPVSQAFDAHPDKDGVTLADYLDDVGQAIGFRSSVDPIRYPIETKILNDYLTEAAPFPVTLATMLSSNDVRLPRIILIAVKGRPNKNGSLANRPKQQTAQAAFEQRRQLAAQDLRILSVELSAFVKQPNTSLPIAFNRHASLLHRAIALCHSFETALTFKSRRGAPKDQSISTYFKKIAIDNAINTKKPGRMMKEVMDDLIKAAGKNKYASTRNTVNDEEFKALRKAMRAEGHWKSTPPAQRRPRSQAPRPQRTSPY